MSHDRIHFFFGARRAFLFECWHLFDYPETHLVCKHCEESTLTVGSYLMPWVLIWCQTDSGHGNPPRGGCNDGCAHHHTQRSTRAAAHVQRGGAETELPAAHRLQRRWRVGHGGVSQLRQRGPGGRRCDHNGEERSRKSSTTAGDGAKRGPTRGRDRSLRAACGVWSGRWIGGGSDSGEAQYPPQGAGGVSTELVPQDFFCTVPTAKILAAAADWSIFKGLQL